MIICLGGKNKRSIKVEKDGEEPRFYRSIKEAAEKEELRDGTIRKHLHAKTEDRRGRFFSYNDTDDLPGEIWVLIVDDRLKKKKDKSSAPKIRRLLSAGAILRQNHRESDNGSFRNSGEKLIVRTFFTRRYATKRKAFIQLFIVKIPLSV